ncbi:MAG: DUF2147 domain-containing protein [Salinivirgaceae bacterium]|nr:MAG: DUF2147 domain-containing protein [Salinivirgaceae bacterium]
MKRILIITALLFSIVALTQGQSVVGKWKTIDHETGEAKSIVEIYMKGGKVYGKIIQILSKPNPETLKCDDCPEPWADKPLIGLDIIRGLEKDGDEWYADEAIISPSRKKVYDCKLWREGDILMVRGYIGWFYDTQEWHKVD